MVPCPSIVISMLLHEIFRSSTVVGLPTGFEFAEHVHTAVDEDAELVGGLGSLTLLSSTASIATATTATVNGIDVIVFHEEIVQDVTHREH